MSVDLADKKRAYRLYQRALRSGELVRPERCEMCNRRPVPTRVWDDELDAWVDGPPRPLHGHHHLGYADEHALDVQWLCDRCHTNVHCAPASTRVRQDNKLRRLARTVVAFARANGLTDDEALALFEECHS